MVSSLLSSLTGYSIFDGRMFRAGAAAILAAFVVFALMPRFLRFLRRADATSDFDKEGAPPSPPILGGLLLVASTLVASLFFCEFNGYVVSTLLILVAYSSVGLIDDVAKIRTKRRINLGKAKAADYQNKADGIGASTRLVLYFLFSFIVAFCAYKFIPDLRGNLTVPFVKPEIWHPYLENWLFIPFISFVITAMANGTNFTDGLDSLVAVPIITCAAFVGIIAYVSGNATFAAYLHIPYLPGVDELFPLAAAIIGTHIAWLWYNCPPAQIYMGDAGSVGFGGALGMMFILVQAGLFLPIVGVVIIAEAFSVAAQIGWFKISGGKRIFLCAPLHHHYQMKWKGMFPSKPLLNSKIAWRMHLVSIFALIVGLTLFFKVR